MVAWLLYRTPFGLRVRAVGEHPAAALSVGVPVTRVRYIAAALSGMLAALGGAYLALDQHQFSAEMTAGRGFIALAATIFGRWDPLRAALACLLFAAAETLQIQLQGSQAIPSQFVEMIPYALTIVALAGVVGRAVPPAALGQDAARPSTAQDFRRLDSRVRCPCRSRPEPQAFRDRSQDDIGKLVVLMITAFIDMVGTLMIIPLLPFYAKSFGANGLIVGLLVRRSPSPSCSARRCGGGSPTATAGGRR